MSDIFTGDFKELRSHWEDRKRANRFKDGGTRTKAVEHVTNIISDRILNHSWLDLAMGAGYIQTKINSEPTIFIGLDFSMAMLSSQEQPLGERILGSLFKIPIRKNSIHVISNFYCLSDYPNHMVKEAFRNIYDIIEKNGIFVYVDYEKNDEYWNKRKEFHGKIIDGKKIIGNINLRTTKDIQKIFPGDCIHEEIIKYKVNTSEIHTSIPLPKIVTRSFIFFIGTK